MNEIQRLRVLDPVSPDEVENWHRSASPPDTAIPWNGPRSRGSKRAGWQRVLVGISIVVAAVAVYVLRAEHSDSDIAVVGGEAATGYGVDMSESQAQTNPIHNGGPDTPPVGVSDVSGSDAPELDRVVAANPSVFLGASSLGGSIEVAVARGQLDEASRLLGGVQGVDYRVGECSQSASEVADVTDRLRERLLSRSYTFALSFDAASCSVAVLLTGVTEDELQELRTTFGDGVTMTVVENMTRLDRPGS